jgi:hypothetical protein
MTAARSVRRLSSLEGQRFSLIEGQDMFDRVKASIETINNGFAGATSTGDAALVSEGQLAYLFDPAKKELSPRLPFSIYQVPLSGN